MNQDNETNRHTIALQQGEIAQLREQLKVAMESRLDGIKELQEAQELFVQAVATLETQSILLDVHKVNHQGTIEYLSAFHRKLDNATWNEEDTRRLGRMLTKWEIKGLRE